MSADKGFFHRAMDAIIESRTRHAEAQVAQYRRTLLGGDAPRAFIQDPGR